MRSGGSNGAPESRGGPEELAQLVASLVTRSGLIGRLADCGVERDRLPELADDAAEQWTATFNPRPVGRDELLALYNSAY
jgi:alcohol dehydrogenase